MFSLMSKTWIPRPLRRAVLARDAAFFCVYCVHGQGPQEIDHVVSEDDAGPTEAANLVVCCEWCNSRKGVMDLDLFATYLERRGKGKSATIIARVLHQLALPVPPPKE